MTLDALTQLYKEELQKAQKALHKKARKLRSLREQVRRYEAGARAVAARIQELEAECARLQEHNQATLTGQVRAAEERAEKAEALLQMPEAFMRPVLPAWATQWIWVWHRDGARWTSFESEAPPGACVYVRWDKA